MKHNFKTIIALCFIALCTILSTSSFSQVPQKFNYQGIARDLKGNPLSKQNLALKIAVLPTEDATVSEYEETQLVTTNEFGLYTLQIGNGTALTGDMKSVKWETGNKYIRVALDPKGGSDFTTIGTSQLLSVPFAIYADKAGQARESVTSSGGTRALALNNYIEKTIAGVPNQQSSLYDNGKIGLGTTTPGANLHIQDAVTNTGTTEIRIQHPNLTNNAARISFFNDASTTFSTTADYGVLNKYAKNKVGSVATGYPAADLFGFNNSQGNLLMSTGGNIGFGFFNQPTSSVTTFMHINSATKNVGIGTSFVTPAAHSQLDVNGTGKANGIHATANQQTVAQTQTATTGILGLITPFVEAIGIFGEAKATGSFPNGNNVGVAGSAVLSTSPQNNVGVFGEAGNASGYNTAVAGQIIQGTGSFFENAAIRGNAPIVPKSYAGIFDGKVAIRDLSQANNFVLTSDASGTATWVNPSLNPLITTAVANAWQLNGNAVGVAGKFLGTTDNFDLNFKVNNQIAGLIQEDALKANTSIGAYAQNSLTTGRANSSLGYYALWSNSTGNDNAAFGWHSLLQNTTGSMNTALGTDVMPFNNGDGNTSVGFQSLYNNSTGNNNTAVGLKALYTNSTGISNIAIGAGAAYNNLSSDNLAVGIDALYSNTTGTQNTAVGNNALNQNTDNYNTAIGVNAMKSSVTGEQNTAVGLNAMSAANGGNYSTAIGVLSLQYNQGTWNTGLGWKTLRYNTTGTQNDAVGVQALGSNTTGGQNVAMGHNAFFDNVSGSLNTALGYRAGEGSGTNVTEATAIGANTLVGNNTTNATAIGSKAYAPNNNTVIIGSINGVNGASADTRVGIGTTAPTSTLHVEGSVSHPFTLVTAGIVDMTGDNNYVGYITAGQTATYNLPDPNTCAGRVYILVNQTSVAQNVNSIPYGSGYTGYWDFFSSNGNISFPSKVPAHSSITIQSFGGGGWTQIQ